MIFEGKGRQSQPFVHNLCYNLVNGQLRHEIQADLRRKSPAADQARETDKEKTICSNAGRS